MTTGKSYLLDYSPDPPPEGPLNWLENGERRLGKQQEEGEEDERND